MQEEINRRSVHEVRVFYVDERLARERRRQESIHHVQQLALTELVIKLFDLASHRNVDVERDRDQRQPWHEGRVGPDDHVLEALNDRTIVSLPIEIEHLAQQLTPDEVRRRGSERFSA